MPLIDCDQYAVMGYPIAHSKSPLIHAAFAAQTGQDLEYTRILVEPDTLAEAIAEFRAVGGQGLNITVPLKQEAYDLATHLAPRANLAGAVNTLILQEDEELFGDNTDGVGLITDLLQNHGIALSDQRILLLGAGGAARGVLAPLLEADPRQLFIANRTAVRAEQLAETFAGLGPVSGGGFEALDEDQFEDGFDLIINATAASLQGEVPPLPDTALSDDGAAYDLMYASEPTPFMQWASALSNGPCLDGLGMLVEQAAESFFLWRGERPDTAPVIAELRGF